MFIEKGLLLKGIASLGVVGVAVGGYVERERIGNLIFGSSSIEESNSLLDRAGIKCDGENGCVLGTGKEIFIRQSNENTNDKKVTTLTPTPNSGAKITLEKLEGGSDYNEGFKFTVKGGNISLGEESPITLEDTETYELKEEGGKFILSRKNISIYRERFPLLEKAGISCNSQSGCVLGENKTIVIRKGDVSREVNALSSSTSTGAKIILEKLEGGNDYNENLKFTVVGGDITLGEGSPITLENTETYELKEEGGKFLFLRKEISIYRAKSPLLEKAGIKCYGPKGCVLDGNKTITIRKGEASSDKEVSSLSSRAKIILEKLNEKNNYNEGFKFTVEGGDIILIKKPSPSLMMERGETYELKEEGGKYILSRKSESNMRRWGDLRVPKTCPETPDSALTLECTIGLADPKNIEALKNKREGIQQFPPSPYINDLMKELKLTLPKDLEDLGVGTPRTKTF